MGDNPVHRRSAHDGEGVDCAGSAVEADGFPADGADSGDPKHYQRGRTPGQGKESVPREGPVLCRHSGAWFQGDSNDAFTQQVYGDVVRRLSDLN